jgi:hypothetical protein
MGVWMWEYIVENWSPDAGRAPILVPAGEPPTPFAGSRVAPGSTQLGGQKTYQPVSIVTTFRDHRAHHRAPRPGPGPARFAHAEPAVKDARLTEW